MSHEVPILDDRRHRDDRLPMLYHNVRQDRRKSATTRDSQRSGATNRIYGSGKLHQRTTTNHHDASTNKALDVKGGLYDVNGGMSDVNIALMRENVSKIRRRKIMKLVESRFVKRFSAVHDMTTLIKDQLTKVSRENAKTSKLITRLCKQVSEFQLSTDYESEDPRVLDDQEAYDGDTSDTTPVSRLPKLPNIESMKPDHADKSRPSSLPQVFRLQNSETEMFSKSKTNNIKRVAYKKSKVSDQGQGQLSNYSENVVSTKSSTDEKRCSGKRPDNRLAKHSAPTEHNKQSQKAESAVGQTKPPGKRPSNNPHNKNKTAMETGKVVSKPRPPQPRQQVKATPIMLRDGTTGRTGNHGKANSSDSTVDRNSPYKSDSSDSDDSDIHEDRSKTKDINVVNNNDKSKKARPFTGLNTTRRREIERQIKNRERSILQPGRKKTINKTVVQNEGTD